MDLQPGFVATVASWHVPGLAVGVVAIVLAVTRRLPGRVRGLLIGGAAAIVVGRIASFGWQIALWKLVGARRTDDITSISSVVATLLILLELTALSLLIAAAVAGRSGPGPSAEPDAAAGPVGP